MREQEQNGLYKRNLFYFFSEITNYIKLLQLRNKKRQSIFISFFFRLQCTYAIHTQNHLIFYFPVFPISLLLFMLLLNVHVHSIKIKIHLCINTRKYITNTCTGSLKANKNWFLFVLNQQKKKKRIYSISNRQRTLKKNVVDVCACIDFTSKAHTDSHLL